MPAPPMPFLPAEQHGKLVIMAMLVYVGDAKEGERVIAPFPRPCDPPCRHGQAYAVPGNLSTRTG